jgi:hypothetical protein
MRLFFKMSSMTHDNDFPPLFDDTPPDDTSDPARAVYARPSSASEPEPDEPVHASETPPQASASVDIDSALAALASLQDLAFQEEPFSDEDYVPEEQSGASQPDDFVAPAPTTGEWAAVAVPAASAPTWAAPLTDANQSPMFTVERGQASSIVPAVLLIAGGAWGVFLIASGSALPVAQLPAMLLASLGVVLLVLWFSLGRRSAGSLFGGMVLLALGLAAAFLTQTETWAQNYPVLAVAVGAACLISAAGIAAYRRWLLLFGISFILGGAGMFAAGASLPPLSTLLPVVIVAAIVLPLILRVLVPNLPARSLPTETSAPVMQPDPEAEPTTTETA